MNESKEIFADPWLKKATDTANLPEDLVFVCAYDLDIGPDFIEEAAFFRRTETADELWIAAGYVVPMVRAIADGTAPPGDLNVRKLKGIGCAFAVEKGGEERVSCLNLLEHLFRARLGFNWPKGFLDPGMIGESDFNRVVRKIERELEENARQAREAETEIIEVARELGLCPQPAGTGPSFWFARCPERNHPLFIDAAENEFGCGWCKRKGGVEELRAFVKERKDILRKRSTESM